MILGRKESWVLQREGSPDCGEREERERWTNRQRESGRERGPEGITEGKLFPKVMDWEKKRG